MATKRKKLAVANWKMNLLLSEAQVYAIEFNIPSLRGKNMEVVVCPSFLYLKSLSSALAKKKVLLGSQDVSPYNLGAYTGDVAALMLRSLGVSYTIVGHSERREYYHETKETLIAKIKQLHVANIVPIFCIGEKLEVREKGEHFSLVHNQLEEVCSAFTPEQISSWVIAYEPVWAIGTGKTASPEQAEEMHRYIRKYFLEKYGEVVAEKISILYGGSVKPENSTELFSCPNIDGALVGGASLNATSFQSIVNSLGEKK